MHLKILILVGLVPCVVAFIVAKAMGARRVSDDVVLSFSGEDAAKAIFRGKSVELQRKASWWNGLNPFRKGKLIMTPVLLEQKSLAIVGEVIHRCGLVLLEDVHEASVKKHYHTTRLVSIVPIFIMVAAVMGKIVGRFNVYLCVTIAVWGLAIACIASLLNVMVAREAVKRGLHELERGGVFKRLSEQEKVEEAAYGYAYLLAAPPMLRQFIKWR